MLVIAFVDCNIFEISR